MSVLIYCSFKSVNGDLKIVYKCPLFYIVVKSEDDDLKNIFKCPSKFIGIFLVFKTELDYADQFQIPPHKDRTKINCHLAMHLEWKTSPNNKSFSIRKKIIAAFFSNLYFFRWNKTFSSLDDWWLEMRFLSGIKIAQAFLWDEGNNLSQKTVFKATVLIITYDGHTAKSLSEVYIYLPSWSPVASITRLKTWIKTKKSIKTE